MLDIFSYVRHVLDKGCLIAIYLFIDIYMILDMLDSIVNINKNKQKYKGHCLTSNNWLNRYKINELVLVFECPTIRENHRKMEEYKTYGE